MSELVGAQNCWFFHVAAHIQTRKSLFTKALIEWLVVCFNGSEDSNIQVPISENKVA